MTGGEAPENIRFGSAPAESGGARERPVPSKGSLGSLINLLVQVEKNSRWNFATRGRFFSTMVEPH